MPVPTRFWYRENCKELQEDSNPQIHSDSEMSFQNAEVPTNLSSAKGGKLQKQDPAGNKGSEKSFSFVKAFLFKEILTDTSKGFA